MRYSPTVTVFYVWLRAVSFLYLQTTVSLSTLIQVLLYFQVFITFYFILVFYYRVNFVLNVSQYFFYLSLATQSKCVDLPIFQP